MSSRRPPPEHLFVRAPRLSVAVIGGGWAGLAAAVKLVQDGHAVTVYEMAGQLGGRARRVDVEGLALDNGQHILIGAYSATLGLMRTVEADPERLLMRLPLQLVDPQGHGLQLPAGSPLGAFAAGVWRHPHWSHRERLALLTAAAGWFARGFRCAPNLTVAALTARLPATLQREVIEPLCVAALNTPADEASAAVFLRVLRDALFSGQGSSDLLLPRTTLAELLPRPAGIWLQAAGASVRLGDRVHSVVPAGAGWLVDGEIFDRVVVATPALEASRLLRHLNPGWADRSDSLRYEPIVTAYVRLPGVRMPAPMVSLPAAAAGGPAAAQFAFDLGTISGRPEATGLVAFVVSGARPWLDLGATATEAAVLRQSASLCGGDLPYGTRVLKLIAEKRATFRCTPGLRRPPADVVPGVAAAGDHVEGPYPATLEGAVRSGIAAARQVQATRRPPTASAAMQ